MDTSIKNTKRAFWTVAVFYFLIAFEFLYMASPFAAYFYSVYKPALEFLDNYPAISWTTGFFLPHLVVETKSSLINAVPLIGGILSSVGLLAFIVCAGQVYYAKLFKKSVVTGGLYKWIRHPQYKAFALCSFGLMLIWPRYLVLIMFISLLFAYYFLARAEEKECEKKFGESYQKYKCQTGMFLPFKPRNNRQGLLDKLPLKIRPIALVGIYTITLFVTVLIADGIKQASITNLYKIEKSNVNYISVIEKTDEDFDKLIKAVLQNQRVDSVLLANPNQKLICYVLPAEMYISEIPMQAPKSTYSHIWGHEYDGLKYKLVYTRANLRYNDPERANLINTLSVYPLLEVWIDSKTNEVLKVIKLKGTQRYGNISEPVF